jgi:uncharacterized membrane-anchored protein YhcB (DUF1043 family)
MVGFIVGVLTCLSIIGVGYLSYRLGRKHTEKPKQQITEIEKRKQDSLKEFNEGINKVINYSVDTDYKGVRK